MIELVLYPPQKKRKKEKKQISNTFESYVCICITQKAKVGAPASPHNMLNLKVCLSASKILTTIARWKVTAEIAASELETNPFSSSRTETDEERNQNSTTAVQDTVSGDQID